MNGTTIRDVRFTSDGLALQGTLQMPAGVGPHPAALLVAGSGPIDRDSDHRRMPLGVTRLLAEALAAAGVASLRFDKRGVGASEGNFWRAGIADNAADARAALAALREAESVDPSRVLVVGHSEGALLAALLGAPGPGSAPEPGLAGVALLAGSARDGEATLRWQMAAIVPTLPRPVRAVLRLLRVDLARKQERTFAKVRASDADVLRLGGKRHNARWFREYLAEDPAASLRRIAVPVLALTGNKDLQVPPEDVAATADLVAGPFTGRVVPDVNHILRTTSGPPDLKAYKKQLAQPLDQRVLDELVAWAAATTGIAAPVTRTPGT